MRYLRIIGIIVGVAGVCMAVSASASATRVTSPTGTFYVGKVHLESIESAVPGTKHILIHNAISNVPCNSTIVANITTHGTGVTAEGNIVEKKQFNCTAEWVADVNSTGNFVFHWVSGYKANFTSIGMELTMTRSGLSCIYKTNNTNLGTIEGGSPALLKLEGNIPRTGGSFLCGGASAAVTGLYRVTNESGQGVFFDH